MGLPEVPRGSWGLPEAARSPQELPRRRAGAPWGFLGLPGGLEAPGAPQGLPEAPRGSQRPPGAPRGSQGLSGAPRGPQRLPDAPRGSQAHPRPTPGPPQAYPSARPSPASPIGFPSQSPAGKTMFGPGQGTGGGLEFPKHTDPLGVAQQPRPVRNGAHWLLLAERRGTFSISPRPLYSPDILRFLWGLGSAPGGPKK